jgi:hypothetical protein
MFPEALITIHQTAWCPQSDHYEYTPLWKHEVKNVKI